MAGMPGAEMRSTIRSFEIPPSFRIPVLVQLALVNFENVGLCLMPRMKRSHAAIRFLLGDESEC